MKSIFVEENTIDMTWFKLLYEIYHNGRKNPITYGSFAGSNRLEFDFVAGTIYRPTTRPLSPIMPDGVPAVTSDKDIEKYFVNYIMDGENLEENEHYRYSTFINGGKYTVPNMKLLSDSERWDGFYDNQDLYALSCIEDKEVKNEGTIVNVPSQVKWIINHYKEKGFGNNHCYITVGYPESSFAYDIPWVDESERQTSPCLRGIDTHIKDNKLHFAVNFRSWDLYGAFPENIGGITLLMEYMASELGVETGPLSFSCLKMHCYEYAIDALKARLNI